MKHDHCVACGSADHLCQHHLVPRSMGGSDEENNLLTLCGECHAKAHHVQSDWRFGELTSRAMQFKKAKGELVGAVPYGYELADDRIHLVESPEEQCAIQQARELKKSGLSLLKIAGELHIRGFNARNGKIFQAEQIRRMI